VYGAAWVLLDAVGRKDDGGWDARERDGWILMGAAALITVVMLVGYNLTFVQHQGRYLFPALPLMALGAALGWQRLVRRQLAVGTALILLLMVFALAMVGLIRGDFPLWPMAMLGAAALGLFALAFVPQRWQGVAVAGLLSAMAVLDLWCLFGFIVPILTRTVP